MQFPLLKQRILSSDRHNESRQSEGFVNALMTTIKRLMYCGLTETMKR